MKVCYILNGQKTEVQAEEGHTLLDTALIAKIPAPYSCMEGSCGSCEAVIEEGRTSEDQENTQIVRTCQALPKSEFVVVNYDKGLQKKICI
ncbi:MAG: 2Fe-2S iron-sulfur cluster binding domain-containing protein [Bdellovibrio sp.]|nr:2Fe-2S iron-sulfur cluster binding domain-containing protein [Bdellovibrio sp.]